MKTAMDPHRRRKMVLKVLKITVGSCMAAIVQFFNLQYAISAGIVTLLTVQDTRRDMIRPAAERLFSFGLSVLLLFLCFRYMGKGRVRVTSDPVSCAAGSGGFPACETEVCRSVYPQQKGAWLFVKI